MASNLGGDYFVTSFLNPLWSDVTFYVNEWPKGQVVDKSKLLRVPGHKCLIASASPVFVKMFANELEQRTEVIITDVLPIDFVNMLSYIYTNRYDDSEFRYSLLLASCRYQLFGLFRSMCKANTLKEEADDQERPTEENSLYLLRHLKEIQKLNMNKWNKLIHRTIAQIRKSFWNHRAYKEACPIAMNLYLDQHSHYYPYQLFSICLKWARHRCTDQQHMNDGQQLQRIRSTIGDLIFKIPLYIMTLTEFCGGPLESGIFSDIEIGKFIERFLIEGPIVTEGDEFFGRFISWEKVKLSGKINTIQVRIGEIRMGKAQQVVILSDNLYTDQIHFTVDRQTILSGFEFNGELESDKVYSVCLTNEQGQTLYNRRSLRLVKAWSGQFFYEVWIDPIRLLANRRYTLSVTFEVEQRQLTVYADFPVHVQDDLEEMSLHVHCPRTLNDAHVRSLLFIALPDQDEENDDDE